MVGRNVPTFQKAPDLKIESVGSFLAPQQQDLIQFQAGDVLGFLENNASS